MARRTVSEHHAKLIANTAAYEAGMARAVAATRSAELRIGGSGRGIGASFQQVGFQVQDFAVQVAGGTSALRAFGQQAPQLLGIFGPAGALAGAALSVGALVAQIAFASSASGKLAKKGDEATESQKRLANAMQSVAAAQRELDGASRAFGSGFLLSQSLESQLARLTSLRDTLFLDMNAARDEATLRFLQSQSESRTPEDREQLLARSRELQANALTYQARLLEIDERRAELRRSMEGASRQSSEAQYEMDLAAAERIAEMQEKRAFDVLSIYEQIDLLSRRRDALISRGDLQALADAGELFERIGKLRQQALETEVANVIQDIYSGGTTQPASPTLAEIPVNSYQRRGLSLDADGGAAKLNQKQDRQIDLLESIDGTLKAARRAGGINWQTN